MVLTGQRDIVAASPELKLRVYSVDSPVWSKQHKIDSMHFFLGCLNGDFLVVIGELMRKFSGHLVFLKNWKQNLGSEVSPKSV